MASSSTSQNAYAATSILTSGWTVGMATGISLFGIPAILNGGASSGVMLRQWQFQFSRGKATIPILAVLNAINYGSVAYRCWNRGLEWRGFAAASASTLFIIPFTLAFIGGVNKRLLAMLESPEKMLSEGSARALIMKWGDLNLARAGFLVAGAGLAMWNFCL
ncbi:hypothetical protein GGR50DRAFT_148139 [Xylaria sp. CBS 124048]|nr:hypothetical protein GGR50DRAFT_148139 [Xylaria sp. CBS 124048]